MQRLRPPNAQPQLDLEGFNHDSERRLRIKMDFALNLLFSEWSTKIPNARLCKAMLDRLTDRAHIIETGTESYRFRRTMARKGGEA
ncbi:MAG: ATP-binding protein [Acidobacteriaceae bacterium]